MVAPSAKHWRRSRVAPNLALLARHYPQRYPHLLESVAQNGIARFDILFAFPRDRIVLDQGYQLSGFDIQGADFLAALDLVWQQERVAKFSSDPQLQALPFRGGWFLYLGYELASQIEPSLHLAASPHPFPTAVAERIPAAILRDQSDGSVYLIVEPGQEQLLEQMAADLLACKDLADENIGRDLLVRPGVIETDIEHYLHAVGRIKNYIRDGDVFQVNLARAWRAAEITTEDAMDIYLALRHHNPAPFAGMARFAEGAILSSSPERLVRTSQRLVETRPIAGTRPRSTETDADIAYSQELLTHPKERAEHIMLIDLERNDLGRICRAGSVEVNELMVLESFAHVHHIVSNVCGELRPEVTPGEVIRAVFPGGTITGCPKVRCMEIITELEEEGRGPYTGSFGYLNHDGDMDLNILIRSLLIAKDGLTLRAGAGIVADSIPEQELNETRAKARGVLDALTSGI